MEPSPEKLPLAENHIKNVPFTIRAHHLINFYDVTVWFENVKKSNPLLPVEFTATKISKGYAHSIGRNFVNTRILSEYQRDLFGSNPDGQKSYQAECEELIYSFLTANDNNQVKIVIGELDDLCKLCRSGIDNFGNRNGGQHCQQAEAGEFDLVIFQKFLKQDYNAEFMTTVGQLREVFRNLTGSDFDF